MAISEDAGLALLTTSGDGALRVGPVSHLGRINDVAAGAWRGRDELALALRGAQGLVLRSFWSDAGYLDQSVDAGSDLELLQSLAAVDGTPPMLVAVAANGAVLRLVDTDAGSSLVAATDPVGAARVDGFDLNGDGLDDLLITLPR